MLKILFLTFSVQLTLADLPKLSTYQKSPPKEIGLYHTDAFERLSENLTTNISHDTKSLVEDMVDIMSSYCETNDTECLSQAHRSMEELQDLKFDNIQNMDVFSPSLKIYMESVEEIVLTLNRENIDEVVELLRSIEADLENSQDIDEEERHVALVSVSVAIESTKLWTSVFSNPMHPLNRLKNIKRKSSLKDDRDNRSLQIPDPVQILGNLVVVCLIDYIGCLASYGNIFVGIGASFVAFLWILDPSLPTLTVPMFFNNVSSAFFPLMPVISPMFPVMITDPPTLLPSSFPSIKPSSMPSAEPSEISSMAPTISSEPSLIPSMTTSVSPSSTPSCIPSLTPTYYPTDFPSSIPTSIPTSIPSSIPTSIPSSIPTSIPTSIPSSFPSKTPSGTPSLSPTSSPSNIPSISTVPSYRPTLAGQ